MTFSIALIIFVLGAVLGSFLNVVILRMPQEQGLSGRSHCPKCRHTLSALDLVPILSFIFLGGKCRYCGKSISNRYIFIETICGLLLVLAFFKFLPSDLRSAVLLIRTEFILLTLVAVFVIDYEHFLILDNLIFPATAILMLLNLAADITAHTGFVIHASLLLNGLLSGIGLMLFFGAIYYISGKRWMGFGDVKLAMFLGLATPQPFIIINVFLAFLLGAVLGIGLLLFRSEEHTSEIPFGTLLALSTALTIFFGPHILDFYLRTVGLSYLASY